MSEFRGEVKTDESSKKQVEFTGWAHLNFKRSEKTTLASDRESPSEQYMMVLLLSKCGVQKILQISPLCRGWPTSVL